MELGEKILISDNSYEVKSLLTPREIEYFALVALGNSNKKIANTLFVSISTVKKTLENVFKKLNANDRANAVARAFILGILSPHLLTKFKNKL